MVVKPPEYDRWLAQKISSIDEREAAAALYCLADLHHFDHNVIQGSYVVVEINLSPLQSAPVPD